VSAEPTLFVDGLEVQFPTRAGIVRAVDGVSLAVRPGEVLGLVGESGSGKTMIGLSVIRLIDPPGRIAAGHILFRGEDLTRLPEPRMRALRGVRIAMMFQDPMMTLNPVLRLDTQIVEALTAHVPRMAAAEARRRAVAALARVGIPSPEERLRAYPHQLSGGMRQRVAIAIALLHRPELLIADEPTTALDVTIQAQILSEVQGLCREYGTALIWITHDLSVVAGLADSVVVLYAGQVVESGPLGDILDRAMHPYTRGLIDSVPSRNRRGVPLRQIAGMAPSPLDLPSGCRFRERCGRADAACLAMPELAEAAPGHAVRCFHPVRDAAPA